MARRLAMVLGSTALLLFAGCLGPWKGLDLEEAAQIVPDPFGKNGDVLDPTFWAEGSGGSLAAEGYVGLPPLINVPPVTPREANQDADGDDAGGEPEGFDDARPASHDDALDPIDCAAGPPPNPAFANAWGTTVGLAARTGVLPIPDIGIPEAEVVSQQHGPGGDHVANGRFTQVLGAPVAFDVLASYRVADADSHSKVSADPLVSNQTTRVELLNVSLLDGLVTADLVRAVAATNATPSSAGYNSAGSVIEGLTVNGEAIPVEQTSHPWTTIDLSEHFGNGSRVSIYETMGHTHMPETPIDGFAGDMIVNMIHVWLRDQDATDDKTDDPLEIIVSHASSHSDYPQFPNCALSKGVLGESYNVHVSGAATGVPVTNGFVKIPTAGGQDEQAANDAHIADTTRLSTLQTGASGGFDDEGGVPGPEGRAVSEAHSVVQDVCILEDNGNCLITATLVEAKAFAEAFPNLTTRSSSEVTIADLKIGTTDVCDTLGLQGECRPEPDTKIPVGTLGTLWLNKQLDLESDGPCHAIVGVRAIYFEPDPSVNLPHVIISEAQAGAFFC